jgi:hypothetical protein
MALHEPGDDLPTGFTIVRGHRHEDQLATDPDALGDGDLLILSLLDLRQLDEALRHHHDLERISRPRLTLDLPYRLGCRTIAGLVASLEGAKSEA